MQMPGEMGPVHILGIGGIAGNGQAELMAALSGEMLAAQPDAIMIDGVAAGKLGPRERRALGSCFVPEERNGHGAVRDMSLSEKAFLSGHVRQVLARKGLINAGKTAGFAGDVIKSFDVRTTGPAARTSRSEK